MFLFIDAAISLKLGFLPLKVIVQSMMNGAHLRGGAGCVGYQGLWLWRVQEVVWCFFVEL